MHARPRGSWPHSRAATDTTWALVQVPLAARAAATTGVLASAFQSVGALERMLRRLRTLRISWDSLPSLVTLLLSGRPAPGDPRRPRREEDRGGRGEVVVVVFHGGGRSEVVVVDDGRSPVSPWCSECVTTSASIRTALTVLESAEWISSSSQHQPLLAKRTSARGVARRALTRISFSVRIKIRIRT